MTNKLEDMYQLGRLMHIEQQCHAYGRSFQERGLAQVAKAIDSKSTKAQRKQANKLAGRYMILGLLMQARLARTRAKIVRLSMLVGEVGFVDGDDPDKDSVIQRVIAQHQADAETPEEDAPPEEEKGLNVDDETQAWLKKMGLA